MTSLVKKNFCPAFSLVEVVLAMGVVSFAILTLLALVPTGMNGFQQAQTNNVETDIVQKINTELQNAPYSSLFSSGGAATNATVFGSSGVRYYDMEGDSLASPTGAVYLVSLSAYPFTNVASDGTAMNISTSSGSILAQTVQFNVVYHNHTNSFSSLVVNKGY
jgi:uncharacterized protein (TIGR02598 family)